LSSLPWLGNVRQLENFCRWITVMATGREVHISDLPAELQNQPSGTSTDSEINWSLLLKKWADKKLQSTLPSSSGLLQEALPVFEKTIIEAALEHTGGRKKDASLLLGWGRNTLTRKMQELGMDNPNPDD